MPARTEPQPRPGDLSSLSDRFMAAVAIAVLKRSTAWELRVRLEGMMLTNSHLLSEAKRADMLEVIRWLRMHE